MNVFCAAYAVKNEVRFSEVDLSLFGTEESGGHSTLAGLVEDPGVAAVTMSYTPGGKRRRVTDSYGYGLPEIVGSNDVTVPLLVGDQEMMMEKPFKCPYCDHRTKEKSAVEKHIRCIHTLEAPYKCRYCNQAFKVQSNLVRHIRAHTGMLEKPNFTSLSGILPTCLVWVHPIKMNEQNVLR